MSRYRKIDPRIWSDEKFRALSDKGKLVFLMLLTHPNMTALGAMRATLSGFAEELGWDAEAFREAFAEVLAKGMAEHDAKACLVALPKFVKYNQPESPNVIKAWTGALDLLPECDLKNVVLHRAREATEGMTEAFAKAFKEAFAKAMPNQKQKQKPKQKTPPQPPADAGGGFDRFWNSWPAHPRKAAREQCERKWGSKGCEPIADKVVAAVEAAKRSEAWAKNGGEFIPAPLTWLNQGRWEAPATAVALVPVKTDDSAQRWLAEQAARAAEVEAQRQARLARKVIQ